MRPLAIDVGNVICKMNGQPFISELSKIAHISEEAAWKFFRLGTAEHDLGHITTRDQMIRELGVSGEAADYLVRDYWNQILEVDEDVMDMLLNFLTEYERKISWDGRKIPWDQYEAPKVAPQVAILSNMGHEHFELMKEKLAPLYSFGDRVVKHYSCEVGARKPSKLFYQSFLLDHPHFKGALYVDDLPENIEAGIKAGFEGFQFNVWDEDKFQKLREIEAKITI